MNLSAAAAFRRLIVVITFVLFGAGLSGSARAAEAGALALIPRDSGAAGADYRLTSHDEVLVEMFNQPDIRSTQRLTSNGEIRLAMIGRVSLEGLTVREAELRVEKLFMEGGFFVKPQVIISVNEYSDRSIAVFGQVRNPNRIPLRAEANTMGILEAVTLAGGFTRIARTKEVQVTRAGSGGQTERFVVNVEELLASKGTGDKREFELMAGDVVYVPERVL